MNLFWTAPLFALMIILSSPSFAVVKTNNAEQRNEKLVEIESQAAMGNQDARAALAYIYFEGVDDAGIKQDIPKGFYWLEKMATNGDATAQLGTAEIYHYGYYSKRNFEKAAFWYQKAAEQGSISAMVDLALFYAGGIGGLDQSCKESIKWNEKVISSGANGDPLFTAQRNLAWILSTCAHLEFRDGNRALKWVQKVIAAHGEGNPGDVDSLAAAYAELGKFNKAVNIQIKAISLLDDDESPIRRENFNARLELYKKEQTWSGASNESPEHYNQQ